VRVLGFPQNSPIRSARSKSGNRRTRRSSARGAGPRASSAPVGLVRVARGPRGRTRCRAADAAAGGDLTSRAKWGERRARLDRGNLDTVTLGYVASGGASGSYTITLSARLGAYNGNLIGTSTATVDLIGASTGKNVVFSFGGAPVPAGSTIAFVQSFTGPGLLFFDVGNGPIGDPTYSGCPGVVETEGTTPPLDQFRRASVGVIITQLTFPAPTITSFTPTTGPVGSSVVITGTNFTGTGFMTSSVRFNGLASTFTVNSSTQITATVPAGATTGPISVTTLGGPATSSTNFTVQASVVTPVEKHRSNVTLMLSAHLVAKGRVNVPDGAKACERGRVVKLQRKKGGSWRTVRTDRTNSTGAYRAALPDVEGTYRSLVKKDRISDTDVCKAMFPGGVGTTTPSNRVREAEQAAAVAATVIPHIRESASHRRHRIWTVTMCLSTTSVSWAQIRMGLTEMTTVSVARLSAGGTCRCVECGACGAGWQVPHFAESVG
jgi:hypothetical protein